MTIKKSEWTPVTDMMDGGREVALGSCRSSWFRGAWQQALCYSVYYKFAAKMIGRNRRVLDIGCGEGLGTWILAKECGYAKGVDRDGEAIAVAKKNWTGEKVGFEQGSILSLRPEERDAVVCFDSAELFLKADRGSALNSVKKILAHDGIAILGAVGTEKEHGELLRNARRHFRHVFIFSANDEMISAGSSGKADRLIIVCCRKK